MKFKYGITPAQSRRENRILVPVTYSRDEIMAIRTEGITEEQVGEVISRLDYDGLCQVVRKIYNGW